ncbi:MAG: DNA mismatch repair endonuclease MutL [Akkermansiaceae bacterium]|nr:DNA mismatch repair endonuclease MutL [Akkermansiaceae bacterium]
MLSDILASQVAAGEVVERPASVVKELVENSIDAGAREIRVDVDQGGAALIRVSDDGCGMSREDALLSLERHATSKLRSSGDLAEIRTLGFRGEAVPSIASVSRFRMVTREADAVAGTEIIVDGGKVRDVRDAGCAPGTVIEAKALFFNMPARRKFLRAEATESAHVEHQLRLHALAAPWVRFRLRRDDREVFDLPPAAKSVDRVRQLLGSDLARELISMPLTHGNGVSVEGFILPASHARKGRRHQFVFLNGRPVEDSIISRALAEGFRGALSEGLHPAAWLWIDLEPHLVDVNVHPAKREVRFHRPLDIRDAILESVGIALRPPAPPPSPARLPLEPASIPAPTPERRAAVFHAPQPMLAEWNPPAVEAERVATVPKGNDGETTPTKDPDPEDLPKGGGAPEFRIMGMLKNRFVVLESEGGLVLFDPKAARERIYYETLLRQHEETVPTQGLLVPVLLEMDPRDFELLMRERVALSSAGIEAEPFGGNTLQILTLPACLGIDDPRTFIGELLDELLHESTPGARFAFDRLARVLARRASWRIQPRLAEARALLEELFTCELPYCAADGRPTLSEFGIKELERRFGLTR